MSSRADELDASLLSSPVGRGADEGRQEGVADVDHRAAEFSEEILRENLHVACKHHQIDVAAQQVKLASFCLIAELLGGGDIDERRAELAFLVGQVGMV